MFRSIHRRNWLAPAGWRTLLTCLIAITFSETGTGDEPKYLTIAPAPPGTLRIATFNVALNRKAEGELSANLKSGDDQAAKIATIVQCVRPDILLVNELDYDGTTAELFLKGYLSKHQPGAPEGSHGTWKYWYTGPVNTGVDSELDLNRNGRFHESDDAWGYGAFPGQYGMAIYSKYPIDIGSVRTFQNFLWSRMPGALRPKEVDPATGGDLFYHSDAIWGALRLSSKSHSIVPISVDGKILNLLASHPTPPVFDGPEDRNGRRNHDEIRLLHDLISTTSDADYLVDDQGRSGPLSADAHFVILGDLNADPSDGDGIHASIKQLLAHPRVARSPAPSSRGATAAAHESGGANAKHRGDPKHDTGDFNDKSPGNLRIDYVLPSANCSVVAGGVYWPDAEESKASSELVQASDHRLVWVDIELH